MVDSRDETHGLDKVFPSVALAREHAAPFSRQTIETAPSLTGLLHPSALQPAAFFQAIQKRIERRHMEFELSARARFDELADFVSMTRARFDDRQDDELGGTLLQLAIEHARVYRCHSHICYRQAGTAGKCFKRRAGLSCGRAHESPPRRRVLR